MGQQHDELVKASRDLLDAWGSYTLGTISRGELWGAMERFAAVAAAQRPDPTVDHAINDADTLQVDGEPQ